MPKMMRACPAVVAVAVVMAAPAWIGAQERATLILKNGRGFEGEVKEVTDSGVRWTLPGLPQPQNYPFDQIDYIEFPQPAEWLQVMDQFEKGRFEEAASAFKQISLQRDSSTHYPAPGNFASLAERRLLDCYRRLRRPSDIAYVAKRIEWDKLPGRERRVEGIVDCWAAVGVKDWEKAATLLGEAEEKLPAISPASAELAYLAGLIAIGNGEPEEAIVHFGRSYSSDASADRAMAADALRRSIELILPDAERRGELRAMVRLYTGLHGNGKLWTDAGEFLEGIVAEQASETQESKPEPKGEGE